MKPILIAAIALAVLPSGLLAGNTSITIQNGIANLQSTTQSGDGIAVTTQYGSGNEATTIQDGAYNLSVIHQNGSDLSQTNVQNGDFNITSSTQVTSLHGAGSIHQLVEGAVISGDVSIEITPED